MKPFLLFFLCLGSISLLLGQTDGQFSAANTAYEQEDYAKAINSYLEVLATGQNSAELCYNLANAFLKNKQTGKAILYYEKALRLSPSDNRIIQNLKIAREEISTPITEIPEFFLLRFWRAFSGLFSSGIWMALQFVLAFVFLYGVYLWRLVADEKQKLKGFVMTISALALMLLSYLAGQTAALEQNRKDVGIVMTTDMLRSGPDNRSDEIENLSSGVKVKIIDTIDDWYKVSLVNKEQGWIKVEAVELI